MIEHNSLFLRFVKNCLFFFLIFIIFMLILLYDYRLILNLLYFWYNFFFFLDRLFKDRFFNINFVNKYLLFFTALAVGFFLLNWRDFLLWGILVLLGHILTASDCHEPFLLLVIIIRRSDNATNKACTFKVWRHCIALSEMSS